MEYGLHRAGFTAAGFTAAAFVEIEPFAQSILRRHWPGVPVHDDVKTFDPTPYIGIDCVVATFPCQIHSVAGKRLASADDRDLWPDCRRIIGIVRPAVVLAENVAGILTSEDGHFFRGVLRDLEALGYSVEWDHIPAIAVGAPHRRDRVFIVGRREGRTWTGDEVEWPQPVALFGTAAVRWPRAGRWSGKCWERRARWPVGDAPIPTPTAQQGRNLTSGRKDDAVFNSGVTLNDFVRVFPTPRAEDAASSGIRHSRGVADTPLGVAVRLWPTPTGQDGANNGAPSQHDRNTPPLNCAVQESPGVGQLAPEFAEWLMGWPVGFTRPDGPSLLDAAPLSWDREHPEAPRLTTERKNRCARVRCIGNGVVSEVATVLGRDVMRSL